MKETPVSLESCGGAMSRAWRSRTATKVLLLAGMMASGVYVAGDLMSGLAYNSSRPYSFRDQWISELTALGSPVRPLMVAVITVHNLLLIAFGLGIWRAAGRTRSLRWAGLAIVATTGLGLVIHPYFPMTSRWLEPGFNDTMHGTLTVVWGLGIFTAVVLAAVAYRGSFRLYSIVALAAMMAFGTASGIAIQGIEQNHTSWAGAFERVNAYALMAWFVVLALMVIRHGSTREAEKNTPTARPHAREPVHA